MPDFKVDFSDILADGTIVVRDLRTGKFKRLKVGDFAQTHDATGNLCHGIVERADDRSGLYWIALDRSTWKDAM